MLKERELPDDYPIYGGYTYVADDQVIVSEWHGITAGQLKACLGVRVLKNCDRAGRRLD